MSPVSTLVVVLLVLLWAASPGCGHNSTQGSADTGNISSGPDWKSVSTGMSRYAVMQTLGQPSKVTLLVKQTEAIWGPQEEWWHKVALGDTLLIIFR